MLTDIFLGMVQRKAFLLMMESHMSHSKAHGHYFDLAALYNTLYAERASARSNA